MNFGVSPEIMEVLGFCEGFNDYLPGAAGWHGNSRALEWVRLSTASISGSV
jgi:hypothetical protein